MQHIFRANIHWVFKTLRTPALSMTDWPGERYDPLLMSPVKSGSIKGRRQVNKGFLSLATIEAWIVNGQDKRFKCLWTWDVSRCQAHRFVSRTTMLMGFSWLTVSRVYQEWSTTQRTSSQLDKTVGSIGANMGQHPFGMLFDTLWSPCPNELRQF